MFFQTLSLAAVTLSLAACGEKTTQHRDPIRPINDSNMQQEQVSHSQNIDAVPTANRLLSEKKTILLSGSRGDQVPGYLWLPERNESSRLPLVMAMYGINGSKEDSTIAEAARILSENGFAVVTIDWPGTGDRGEEIDSTRRVIDAGVLRWTVEDYEATLNYLGSRADIDINRVGFVGASMGAMTGLAFMAQDQRVKAMVPIVPIPNPLWAELDPSVTIRSVAPRPVLCISTSDNSDFSGLVCNQVQQNGTTRAFSGGHQLSGFEDKVLEETLAFLKKNL